MASHGNSYPGGDQAWSAAEDQTIREVMGKDGTVASKLVLLNACLSRRSRDSITERYKWLGIGVRSAT